MTKKSVLFLPTIIRNPQLTFFILTKQYVAQHYSTHN